MTNCYLTEITHCIQAVLWHTSTNFVQAQHFLLNGVNFNVWELTMYKNRYHNMLYQKVLAYVQRTWAWCTRVLYGWHPGPTEGRSSFDFVCNLAVQAIWLQFSIPIPHIKAVLVPLWCAELECYCNTRWHARPSCAQNQLRHVFKFPGQRRRSWGGQSPPNENIGGANI